MPVQFVAPALSSDDAPKEGIFTQRLIPSLSLPAFPVSQSTSRRLFRTFTGQGWFIAQNRDPEVPGSKP